MAAALTLPWFEFVNLVRIRIFIPDVILVLAFNNVGRFVQSASQPRLPLYPIWLINAFTISAGVQSPFLQKHTLQCHSHCWSLITFLLFSEFIQTSKLVRTAFRLIIDCLSIFTTISKCGQKLTLTTLINKVIALIMSATEYRL